jgi:hypothetical protein
MAGYRTSAPASDKGVYIGQARHAVKELITSLRGELATLEAVYAMMCQGRRIHRCPRRAAGLGRGRGNRPAFPGGSV